MAIITAQEVLAIARISRLHIEEQEIEKLVKQLQSVLNYAERVKDIAADIQSEACKSINIFRDDASVVCDANKMLSLAPQQEEHFYVIPSVLDSK